MRTLDSMYSVSRKALIIACPGYRGVQGYLPGTLHDIENYTSYLYSSLGGSWEEDEIEILTNPTGIEVSRAISRITAHYSFIVYTGHGFTHTGDRTTYIDLDDGEYSISLLNTSS